MGFKSRISKNKDGINRALLFIFLFNVVFLPADTFSLKIVSLFLLIVLNFQKVLNQYQGKECIIFIFGFVVTSFTILLSIALTGDFSNIQLGYMGYILLLYPIIKSEKVNFYHMFLMVLDALAIFTVIMCVLDVFNIISMYNNALLMWFHNTNNAMIGKGSHTAIGVMYFFKTSPLLFLSLMERLRSKKYIISFITSIAIILSGTRANVLCLVFVLMVYAVFLCPSLKVRLITILLAVILFSYLLLNGMVINLITEMFTRKAGGDAIRDGHLKGIIELFKEEPIKLFLGSGFSSTFYTYAYHEFIQNIELSYWNLLRQVGLFVFVLMMFMFLYPLFRLYRDKRNFPIIVGYILYLVIAYTNPLLYSSTGMTAVLFMYYKAFVKIEKDEICSLRYSNRKRY